MHVFLCIFRSLAYASALRGRPGIVGEGQEPSGGQGRVGQATRQVPEPPLTEVRRPAEVVAREHSIPEPIQA